MHGSEENALSEGNGTPRSARSWWGLQVGASSPVELARRLEHGGGGAAFLPGAARPRLGRASGRGQDISTLDSLPEEHEGVTCTLLCLHFDWGM